MGLPKPKEHWTVEEYLEFEKTSPVRYEYVGGQIYAMAGGTKNHNRIADDLGSLFNRRFADGRCEAFTENVKVKVGPELFYYPDVIVTCEPGAETEDENEYIIENPLLIVEVLSKTTTRIDRREKKQEYQHLPGLREYVIIEQNRMQVEIHRHRNVGEEWQIEIYTDPEEEARFESIDAKVKLSDIYRRVRFVEKAEETE
jgi:Uma2 family endonuclease